MGRTVLVATNNSHKLDEIKTVFSDGDWRFITLGDAGIESDPEETAEDFIGNARIKARSAQEAVRSLVTTLQPYAILADDSGLEVDALDGRPGVYSARYAGEGCSAQQCNTKLLDELANTAPEERTARFTTVLVFLDEDGSETTVTGHCEGAIGNAPIGEQGFGYDPIFLPHETPGKTMAQLSQAEKNAISHRGNALRALREAITN